MRFAKDYIRKQNGNAEKLLAIKQKRYHRILKELLRSGLTKKHKILEIGSGIGPGIIYFKKKKYDILGIEPETHSINACKKNLAAVGITAKIVKGAGEQMRFPNNTFDFIIAKDVLEHVNDINKVLRECYRILKPKGKFYFECPDYLFPYEGHFKVPYPPLLPKILGKLYLRLFGFSKDEVQFLDHVIFTTNRNIDRIISHTHFTDNNLHYKSLKGWKRRFYRFTKISPGGKVVRILTK